MSQNLTYLTTTSELNSVANAIRTKGGTSATLEYPQGFIDAIDDIETGGGGGETVPTGAVPTDFVMDNLRYVYYPTGAIITGNPTVTGWMNMFSNLQYDQHYGGYWYHLDHITFNNTQPFTTVFPCMFYNCGYLPLFPQSFWDNIEYINNDAMDRRGWFLTPGSEDLVLPNIKEINNAGLAHNTSLKSLTIGPSIQTIGQNACRYNSYIDTITILGKPNSIGFNAFAGNKSGAVMNVVWSEGEVSGAPWGFDGTINYDYVAPTE